MATATPTRPNPAAARDAAVEQAIAAAAGKVRSNDLFTGAAAAAVLFLGYLAVIVTLDKLLDLPDWVRLLGLLGLLGGLGAVVYYLIVRPMQRRVNPRYVARKIEETMPDAKNVLINWVDLQDKELPGNVKAAVGTKAAEGVADADMDSATNSKKLIWLGSAAGVLVLVLAVLFLVFSGPQFLSLVGRAVVPFKPTEIASATTISIDEPESGDVTITDGQPLTIAISLGGRLPNPNGPDKPRLLVRYSQEETEEIELPLTATGSSREFRIDLGRGTILNGFWYRVAAGDARTPEHQVKVITRPMLSEFKASYEYPAYLKWKSDEENGTKLRAIRGTVVTLTAKANRPLKSASLTVATVDGGRELIRGEVFDNDHVRFKLKLRESGTYRIEFKPNGPELSTATADYPIEVEVDHKPVVEINTPKEEEIQLPLNGLLAVDGNVKDDHGIAGVELRFKVIGNDLLVIQPKKFRDGKPLVREQDNTLLTDLPDYKDSVKLDALNDADGKPVKLTEKDVLEYWVAATDNCTEPEANVGESAHKKVRLLPAIKEPEKKQEQANQAQQRKKDEQKTEEKRDEKLKNEKRPEEQNHNPERQPQQEKQPNEGNQDKDPMKAGGDNTQKDPMKQPEGDPQKKPDGQPQGEQGNPPPNPEEQKKKDDFEHKLQERKEQQKREGSDARGDGDKSEGTETKPEAGTKPSEGKQGGDGGSKGAAQEKEGPKTDDMTKPEGQPSQNKDGGHLTEPEKSTDKAPPKDGAKGEDKPTDDQPKKAPKEGTEAGTSKESKEGTKPEGTKPDGSNQEGTKPDGSKPENKKQDGSAGAARGAEPPPQGDKPQGPMDNGTDTQQPQDGKEKKVDPKDLGNSKPKGDPTRGETKPEKGNGSEKTEQPKDASSAKGATPNKTGESKDQPKGNGSEPMPKKGPPDAGQEKEGPKPSADGKNDPSEGKGEGKKPEQSTGSKDDGDKGSVKPSDTTKKPDGSGEKNPDKNQTGNGDKKLDPKEMEQAIKDLESKDDKTKKGAQEKLDKAVGKGNREQIEQIQKDLKSDDKAKQDAAKQKLEDMKKEAQKNAGGQQQPMEPKELTEQEKKELLDAAKNLDSKDPQTKKDAQEKLDKAIGKENREQVEQMQKDLKSDDKAKQDAAKQKLEDMAKKAQEDQKNAGNGGQKPKELTEQEKKELIEAAKNLDSKDEKTKKEAQEKLDKAMGKENREKVEKMQKDLKSDDKATCEAAEKQVQEMAKNAQPRGDKTTAQKQPEMTEQQKKELADAMKNLNSKDEAERKAAEQKIDEAVGKQQRQELQQDLKDLQGNDPEKAEQARKKLEKKLEEMKNAQNGNNKHNDKLDPKGPAPSTAPGQPLDANLENQLKTEELKLKSFQEVRGDKQFLKDSNITEDEYNRFLKEQEAAVQKLRDKVAEARVNPTPEASGPATIGRNGFGKLETRGNSGQVNGSGTQGAPPPGFGDAVKRFNTEASKQK